jgi:hypothetical protein
MLNGLSQCAWAVRTSLVKGALVVTFFFRGFEDSLSLRNPILKLSFIFFKICIGHLSANQALLVKESFNNFAIFECDCSVSIYQALLPVLRVPFCVLILLCTLAFLKPIHEVAIVYYIIPENKLALLTVIDPVFEGASVLLLGYFGVVLELDLA